MAKSEFILAFNEIAETRKLPREVILDALCAALVSAYRRDSTVSSAQMVEAHVDEKTGEPSVWVEKEVVDEVQSEQTEVSLKEARNVQPAAQLGDMVMVDDTPEDFGRIAAQTAKQVILQRMREAEREAQFQEYQERVGDLVTGTVQSDSGDVVTIGLGRTEAILPRSQQVPGERYKMHDKVRAYVMEVRRTNRGPQIVVSRTHRNMLRRLLEYEVPEIYNGTVEIKGIAREPGARSKVAVAALQPGADPVGACVGMRGMRIQSIVKELNNEKIDVIEWSPDQSVFISKALSPARVSTVFLDDDPEAGRTAIVVVPDDQLSLAIGREGQNARLAAKLTGWRIDIKSVTEASKGTFDSLQAEELEAFQAEHADMYEQAAHVLEKKASGKPIMPEDYDVLIDFARLVENRRLRAREEVRSEWRARYDEAKSHVPAAAYEHPLEETDLPLRVYNALDEADYKTVGEVMEQYFFDSKRLLEVANFGPAALEAVEEMINTITFPEPEVEAVEAEVAGEAIAAEAAGEPAAEAAAPVEGELAAAPAEAGVEQVVETAGDEETGAEPQKQWVDEEELARVRRAELVARMTGGEAVEPVAEEEEQAAATGEVAPELEAVSEAGTAVESEDDETLDDLEVFDDLLIDYENMTKEEKDELDCRRAKQRRRQLVFDEDLGRVVAKRRRKRGTDDWEEEWDGR